jgi:hypothetical protein
VRLIVDILEEIIMLQPDQHPAQHFQAYKIEQNPYRFVRPLWRPQKREHARGLLGRCPPPPQDRVSGYSGVIVCALTARTPLVIPDTEDVDHDPTNEDHPVYRSLRIPRRIGQRVIPGSSIRGPVSSIFEAATNSCFRVFDHGPVVQRLALQKAPDSIPGRLEVQATAWKVRLFQGDAHGAGAGWQPAHTPVGTPLRAGGGTGVPANGSHCWAALSLTPMPGATRAEYEVYALLPDAAIPATVPPQQHRYFARDQIQAVMAGKVNAPWRLVRGRIGARAGGQVFEYQEPPLQPAAWLPMSHLTAIGGTAVDERGCWAAVTTHPNAHRLHGFRYHRVLSRCW